jgi:hypothetical protein
MKPKLGMGEEDNFLTAVSTDKVERLVVLLECMYI